jgi:hypothetical protein
MWLGAAVLFCGITAVSAFDVFEEFAGERQTASAQAQAFALSKPVPVVVVDSFGQGRSSPPTVAAPDNAASHSGAPGRVVLETTGSAMGAMALPPNADSTAATANTFAKIEQPDIRQPLPRPRTTKKKSARRIDTSQGVTTQVYTPPDSRQMTVRRSGRNPADGGFWGNQFGARAGAPIQLAHQRAFGWPF